MKHSAQALVGLLLPSLIFARVYPRSNTTELGLLATGNVDLGDWADAYAKAQSLVAKMTNEEKISVITAGSVESAGWKALNFKDSAQGPQGYEYATGFGMTSALAQTWDKAAIYEQFKAIGDEFYGKGFQVANGPSTQPFGRTPYSGRLAEGLGQDAYLNGVATGLGTKAFVDAGVISGGKHFLLNEQETNRALRGDKQPYSAVVDDKALHETYLWPFYDAIKAGMGSVMCAMNKVNGSLSCENSDLLNKLLKTELGFPGQVQPDVSAQATPFGSANGGLDYGSSRIWGTQTLIQGIASGNLSQARLDDMAIRNIIPYYKSNLANGKQPPLAQQTDYVDVRANHSKIVRSVGAASIVLLKNINNALPLSKPRTMAIFGNSAGPATAGPNYQFTVDGSPSTYNGHLAGGAGSGMTSFPYLITPQHALTSRAAEDGTMIRWILNNTYTNTIPSLPTPPGLPPLLSGGTALHLDIPPYATGAEVCLVFINAFAGEGGDRTELRNTEQDALITTVASHCPNTIVVINTIGTRLVESWIENPNVTAVLYGMPLGQESGNSIVDVLYGAVNPSGRLTHTLAKNEGDYPGICTELVCNFVEGNLVDYKYFDSANVEPRFEFGFGLSYTTFSYSEVTITTTKPEALASKYATGKVGVGGRTDLWDEVASASVTVTNNGTVDGAEVVQLYISYPEEAAQPVRVLRGFEKITLPVGGQGSVDFGLKRRDLSFWDVEAQEWAVAKGTYMLSVGASSRDLRVSGTLVV
ncbi:hypothetical protein HYALB_00005290 [Hymenoscyphus albidus]|uniref:beta-glucosidase n=1 Tax=Hymenoscyphus albidus TaxID=595503 RepID=A0A9N9LE80_9HELO|nr:hypothetical protein HYALB_00005290 [Hymenoscyphus albidus]